MLTIIVFLSSCATHKYAQINYAKFYQEDYPGSVFKTQVFNANDSMTELFVQVNLNTLAIVSGKTKTEVAKDFVFDYSLVEGLKEKEVMQEGKVAIAESPDADENSKSFKIKLKTPAVGQFVLFSSVQSENLKKSFTSRTSILKGVVSSEQNFMLLKEDGTIHWDNYISGNEKVRIQFNDSQVKELYVNWYAPKFSPAVVPFSPGHRNEVKNLDTAETFKIALINGKSELLTFKDLGIYQFRVNPNDASGYSLIKFYAEFPYVYNDAQRLFSLRYLNPRYEFEDLMAMEPAEAVKEFWYSKSRKAERSEDMMETYYGRVQRANELFTSYKEGWKTDRGMIFMVYGAPDKVHIYKDREVWEYGNDSYYNGLRFEFTKQDNPFTQNDFQLFRQTHFERSWQGIVNNWRTDI
ncbi:MAG: GWxTD domain-containing protein [Bacteroidales bacterium]|nr:GWxTD domain-containing protein [Bacteroidales bacterium]